jgi:hypothetical protein
MRGLRSANKISKWVMVWVIAMLMIFENRGRKKTIIIMIIKTETNCHAMPATINAASLRASGSSVREREIGAWATDGKKPHEATAADEESAQRRHRVLGGFFRRVLKWSPFVGGISVRFFLSAHGNFGICIKVICQVRKFY